MFDLVVSLTIFGGLIVIIVLIWLIYNYCINTGPKRRIVKFAPNIKTVYTKEMTFKNIEILLDRNNKQNLKLTTNMKREYIDDIEPCAAFMIKNVLTNDECNLFINILINNKLNNIKFKSNNLSDIIFKRIKPYLIEKSYFDCGPLLSLNEFENNLDDQFIEIWGTLYCMNNIFDIKKCYHNNNENNNKKYYYNNKNDNCIKVNRRNINNNVYTIYKVVFFLTDNPKNSIINFVKNKDSLFKNDTELMQNIYINHNIGDCLVFRNELMHNFTNKNIFNEAYVMETDVGYKALYGL